MSIQNGDISISANFQLNVSKPLDSRTAVSNFSDLVNIAFKHSGMIVYVTALDAHFTLDSTNTWNLFSGETGSLVADNGITISNDIIELGGALTKDTIITSDGSKSVVFGLNTTSENIANTVFNTSSFQINTLTSFDGNGRGNFININAGEFSSNNYASTESFTQISNGTQHAYIRYTDNQSIRLYLNSGGIPSGSGQSFTINDITITEGIDFVGQGNHLLDATSIAGLDYSTSGLNVPNFISVSDDGGEIYGCYVTFNFTNKTTTFSETFSNCSFMPFDNKSVIEVNLEGTTMKYGTTVNTTSFTIGKSQTIFTDATTLLAGIQYADDYSTTYTNRSLVDKEYVDTSVTSATLTATNGITITSNIIELGGALNKDSTISGNEKQLSLGDFGTGNNLSELSVKATNTQILAFTNYDGTGTGSFMNFNPSGVGITNAYTPGRDTSLQIYPTVVSLLHSNTKIIKLTFNNIIQAGETFTINGVTFTEGVDFFNTGNVFMDANNIASINYSSVPNFVSVSYVGAVVKFTFSTISTFSETFSNANFSYAWGSNVKATENSTYLSVGYSNNPTSLEMTDSVTIFTDASTSGAGIQYADDYSATYTDRSLVDKGYVDTSVTSATLTATNGITITDNIIELGGALTKDTIITSDGSKSLVFGGLNETNENLAGVLINSSSFIINTLTSFDGDGRGTGVNINAGEFSVTNYVSTQSTTQLITGSAQVSIRYTDNQKIKLALGTGGIISGGGETFTINGVTFTEGVDFTGQNDNSLDAVTLASIDYSGVPNFISVTNNGISYGVYYITFVFTDNTTSFSETLTNCYFNGHNMGGQIGINSEGCNITCNLTSLNIGPNSTILTDSTVNQAGIEYADDYSATYTDRSLVDKEYVTNAIYQIPSYNGTTDRISITSGIVDIDINYSGQTTINTVGALSIGSLTTGFTAINDEQISSASTWNSKQDAIGYTTENVANKVDVITIGNGTNAYPTSDAVIDYIAFVQSRTTYVNNITGSDITAEKYSTTLKYATIKKAILESAYGDTIHVEVGTGLYDTDYNMPMLNGVTIHLEFGVTIQPNVTYNSIPNNASIFTDYANDLNGSYIPVIAGYTFRITGRGRLITRGNSGPDTNPIVVAGYYNGYYNNHSTIYVECDEISGFETNITFALLGTQTDNAIYFKNCLISYEIDMYGNAKHVFDNCTFKDLNTMRRNLGNSAGTAIFNSCSFIRTIATIQHDIDYPSDAPQGLDCFAFKPTSGGNIADFTFNNCSFYNNVGGHGISLYAGGAYANTSKLHIDNCNFYLNDNTKSPLYYNGINGLNNPHLFYLSNNISNTEPIAVNGATLTNQYIDSGFTIISEPINLNNISATTPISYNNTSGTFAIQVANTTQDGYLTSTDWNRFDSKQNTLLLTTNGTNGSSTLISNTLNIPTYTLSGLGGQALLNGTGFVRQTGTTTSYVSGTSAQFIKADGSLDSSSYVSGSGLTTNNIPYWNGTNLVNSQLTRSANSIDSSVKLTGVILGTGAVDGIPTLTNVGDFINVRLNMFAFGIAMNMRGGSTGGFIKQYDAHAGWTQYANTGTNPNLCHWNGQEITSGNIPTGSYGGNAAIQYQGYYSYEIHDRAARHIRGYFYVNGSGVPSNLVQTKQETSGLSIAITGSPAKVVVTNTIAIFARLVVLETQDSTTPNFPNLYESWSNDGQTQFWTGTGGLGVGHTSQNAKAILQADSTDKGFLPPRMTLAQRSAITSMPVGLIIYQTDGTEGLYLYKTGGWSLLNSTVNTKQTDLYFTSAMLTMTTGFPDAGTITKFINNNGMFATAQYSLNGGGAWTNITFTANVATVSIAMSANSNIMVRTTLAGANVDGTLTIQATL